MARRLNRLSAVEVKAIDRKGMYNDGGGLYLQVSPGGAKSWIYRFMLDARTREMGLGPVHTIPLVEARKRAAECRRMRLDGIDPIEARRAKHGERKLEAARGMTFDACAAAYLEAHEEAWRNAKHREQWRNTLSSYASPGLRFPAGAVGRCLADDESLGTDLEDQIGNGEPGERTN